MTPAEIPQKIYDFVTQSIDSIELLRVLLLLSENPDRVWTVNEIKQNLSSSDSSIEKRLNDLYSRKILIKSGNKSESHHFTPYSHELGLMIKELAEFNKIYPYLIIELIYSRHNQVLNAFAEAFKFKKDN